MANERARAVLVGVQLPSVSAEDHQASLAELGRLATTLGYVVVGEVTQRRSGLAAGSLMGEGKLEELATWTGGKGRLQAGPRRVVNKARAKWEEAEEEPPEPPPEEGEENEKAARRADVVLVDHDLTPSQARNLEKATGVEVLDRTGVIVEIFHRHAQSRQARMQVEIARLTSHACTAFRNQEEPEQRKLLSLVLKNASWKGGQLQATLFEPFELVRRSNQTNTIRFNDLTTQKPVFANWLPGMDSNHCSRRQRPLSYH